MTTKADFTSEEWAVLMEAPNAAAIAVVLTDLAGGEYVEEAAAIFRFIREASTRYPDNPLVQDVIADLLAPDGDAHPPSEEEPERTAEQQLNLLRERLTAATEVLDDRGSDHCHGFKQFLHDLAVHVAEAASEEALGEGDKVSAKEEAFLQELATLLKLSQP